LAHAACELLSEGVTMSSIELRNLETGEPRGAHDVRKKVAQSDALATRERPDEEEWVIKRKKATQSDAPATAGRGSESATLPPAGAEGVFGAHAAGTRRHRVGRVNITGYFDPAVKRSLRLIQAEYPDRTVQDLLTEALNDLFCKYNVPQTADIQK
jgi:hypothetical protein